MRDFIEKDDGLYAAIAWGDWTPAMIANPKAFAS
jgi:hypothetical protein